MELIRISRRCGIVSSMLVAGCIGGASNPNFRELIRYDLSAIEGQINFGCRNSLRLYVRKCCKEGIAADAFRTQIAKWLKEDGNVDTLNAACNALHSQLTSVHSDGYNFEVHTSYPELAYDGLVTLCETVRGQGGVSGDDEGDGLVVKVGALEDIGDKFRAAYNGAAGSRSNPHLAAFGAAIAAQFPGWGGEGAATNTTTLTLGDAEQVFRSTKPLNSIQKSLLQAVFASYVTCGYSEAKVRTALGGSTHLFNISSEDEFKLYGLAIVNHAQPDIDLSGTLATLGELFRLEGDAKYGYVPVSLVKIMEFYHTLTASGGESAVDISCAAFITACKSFLRGEVGLFALVDAYNTYGAAIRGLKKGLTEGVDAAQLGLAAYSDDAGHTQAKVKVITALFRFGLGRGTKMFSIDPNAWDKDDDDAE
jgi:hypothetical protein